MSECISIIGLMRFTRFISRIRCISLCLTRFIRVVSLISSINMTNVVNLTRGF